MHFAYPWFLLAAAVIAIPIIIHLFNMRRAKTIFFPSIRFLKNIELEQKKQNKLKHYIVLTCRCLALLALVLAFALPFFGNKNESNKKWVSIYIDNSFSMENKNNDGIKFETAKQKARELIKSYDAATSFFIFPNNPQGKHQQFVSATEAIQFIDELQISNAVKNISQVYKNQTDMLSAQSGKKTAYFISDFQKGFCANNNSLNPVKDIQFYALEIPFENNSNISIDTAWLSNPFALAGEENSLEFDLQYFGEDKNKQIPVKLTGANGLNGIVNVGLKPFEKVHGKMPIKMPSAAETPANLYIETEDAFFDNKLFITLQSPGIRNVLVFNSNEYLQTALNANTFFKNAYQSNSNYSAINSFQTVIINNFTGINENESSQLNSFLQNGGNVIVIPSINCTTNGINLLKGVAGIPKFVNWKKQITPFSSNTFQNAFFQLIFEKTPKQIGLPKINEYLSSAGNTGLGENIISLDNGEPFLLKFTKEKGQLYLFTSSLDKNTGNFVQSSLFLPVLTICAGTNEKSGSLYGIAGSNNTYSMRQLFDKKENNLQLKLGSISLVPEIQNRGSVQELFCGNYIEKAGNYSLESNTENSKKEFVAINYSRIESNTQKEDARLIDEFMQKTNCKNLQLNISKVASELSKGDLYSWRLFIWLALAFFALEIMTLVFWDKIMSLLNSKNE